MNTTVLNNREACDYSSYHSQAWRPLENSTSSTRSLWKTSHPHLLKTSIIRFSASSPATPQPVSCRTTTDILAYIRLLHSNACLPAKILRPGAHTHLHLSYTLIAIPPVLISIASGPNRSFSSQSIQYYSYWLQEYFMGSWVADIFSKGHNIALVFINN